MGPARMLVWGLGFGVWGLGLKKDGGPGSDEAGGKGERLAPLRFAARGSTARVRERMGETNTSVVRARMRVVRMVIVGLLEWVEKYAPIYIGGLVSLYRKVTVAL
jgi:hypothetical protein